jgi:two-component system alkaline phosphatase synthesis response regulator PhoP
MNHILLADDDTELCTLLSEYLHAENFQVEMVHDGETAVQYALSNHYDLMILDVMMPRKNGYELCDELKADENYKDITVILLTAVADAVTSTSYTHMDGKTTMADDFVPKPIDLDNLMEIVKDNLEIS